MWSCKFRILSPPPHILYPIPPLPPTFRILSLLPPHVVSYPSSTHMSYPIHPLPPHMSYPIPPLLPTCRIPPPPPHVVSYHSSPPPPPPPHTKKLEELKKSLIFEISLGICCSCISFLSPHFRIQILIANTSCQNKQASSTKSSQWKYEQCKESSIGGERGVLHCGRQNIALQDNCDWSDCCGTFTARN